MPDTRLHEAQEDVALACRGDQRAFERLYRVHVARIRGLARRMAGPDAADELTQDIFVHAWEKLGTFRGDARFGTWLYRLGVNVIIENRRGATRRALREQDDPDAVRTASVGAVDGVASLDLRSAIDRLPEGARHVFVLHDIEGYQHNEIGEMMGISVGTSKGQLHRARLILRKHLLARRAQTPPDGRTL